MNDDDRSSVTATHAESKRVLSADGRGTVLLMGLVFAVLLVGAAFHVASTGHAIIWREMAQDGADHAAYEASLWNARGMNLVVAINIFKAVVMAVLVLFRALQLFVIAALALAATGCALGVFAPPLLVFCGALPFLTTLNVQLEVIDQRVTRAVFQMQRVLTLAQRGIASATPLISASASAISTNQRFDVTGIGLSTSLIPNLPGRATACNPLGGGEERLGVPVSLPVVDSDDVSVLCGKGAKIIPKLLDVVTGGTLKPVTGPVSKLFEKIAKKGSFFLCEQNAAQGVAEIFAEQTQPEGLELPSDRAAKFCDAKNQDLCKTTPASCEGPNGAETKEDLAELGTFVTPSADPALPATVDTARCRQAFNKKYEARDEATRNRANAALSGQMTATWADVWSLARNGNLYMQSWGLTFPNRPVDAFYDGITLPGKFATEAIDEVKLEHDATAVAQAEMFFDCEGPWDDEECSEVAPWTMNWRARLRRVWDPADIAQGVAEGALLSAFDSALGRIQLPAGVNDVLNRFSALRTFTDIPDQAADYAHDAVADRAGSAAFAVRDQLRTSNRRKMVH